VVFLGGLVKLAIVYAHTPPCDSALRDELILIAAHYCHASLLGHNLNGANPFTIGYWVDNLSMKEFQNFLFHYLPHVVVEPTLRFS
jgi:aminopeptidase-like protein